jgi:hypothetical protein
MVGKHPKHPRGQNQWAKLMADIATSVAGNKQRTPEEQLKGPATIARVRPGGLKGGEARAEKPTPEERLASARKAVRARWNRPLRQNGQQS